MENIRDKVTWGILSTAKIGVDTVIPAMQNGELTEVLGIASRDAETARKAADELNIERSYGSYDEMLADPDIMAVYIPLPNHMHYEWMERCIEAGKHVLCEKPLVLDSSEISRLKILRDKSGLVVGEAFMVLHQPRWVRAKELFQSGALGKFVAGNSIFSYYNMDPDNIRNIAEFGGGGVWDIGCYPTVLSRFVLGEEPRRVSAALEFDPEFGTDRLGTVILEYPSGPFSFTISTQMVAYQYMQFFGSEKMMELNTPFNTPDFRAMTIRVNSGNIHELPKVAESFSPSNQYTKQGDAFARSVLYGEPFTGSLENAENNCKVLEAILLSAKENRWVDV